MANFRGKKREKKEFEEQVIEIKRVSRTVKGGKRMRFRALVVIGNKAGKVGMGVAKGNDVQVAVQKAVRQAKKGMFDVALVNETIPSETQVKYSGTILFAKPASAGTSIIAGGAARLVFDMAGVKNIIAKIYGSRNKANVVYATIDLLKKGKMPIAKPNSKKKASKENPKTEKPADKTAKKAPAKAEPKAKKSTKTK